MTEETDAIDLETFKTLSGKRVGLIFLWDLRAWARKPIPASEMRQIITNVEKAERCPVTVLGFLPVSVTPFPTGKDSFVIKTAEATCEKHQIPQDDVRYVGYKPGDGLGVITLMFGGK